MPRISLVAANRGLFVPIRPFLVNSRVTPSLPANRRPRKYLSETQILDGEITCQAVKSAEAEEQLDENTMQLISDLSAKAEAYVKEISQKHLDEAKAEGTKPEFTELRNKVMKSILDLQSGLLERETEVRLLLLAALCREHLLLLGPPGDPPFLNHSSKIRHCYLGTAKSELSRRLSSLCGGRYFERLLTRFSVPEELFGPLSMKGNPLPLLQTAIRSQDWKTICTSAR